MSKSEMERLARKAWPDSERLHVDVDGDRDPNPFVEVYGELGGYKCVELACCNDRAVPAMLAALRVLAGEEDPELAALRAENERLKAELAEANERAENFDSALAVAKNSREYNRCRAEKAEAQLRDAQATIERVRELREAAHEAVSVFGREALSGHALDTLERLQSALASARPEQEVRS